MRLLADNGKIKKDKLYLMEKILSKLSEKEMEKIRGNEIGMIFQDPMTSLNPVFTIGDQLMEPLIKHKELNKNELLTKLLKCLN